MAALPVTSTSRSRGAISSSPTTTNHGHNSQDITRAALHALSPLQTAVQNVVETSTGIRFDQRTLELISGYTPTNSSLLDLPYKARSKCPGGGDLEILPKITSYLSRTNGTDVENTWLHLLAEAKNRSQFEEIFNLIPKCQSVESANYEIETHCLFKIEEQMNEEILGKTIIQAFENDFPSIGHALLNWSIYSSRFFGIPYSLLLRMITHAAECGDKDELIVTLFTKLRELSNNSDLDNKTRMESLFKWRNIMIHPEYPKAVLIAAKRGPSSALKILVDNVRIRARSSGDRKYEEFFRNAILNEARREVGSRDFQASVKNLFSSLNRARDTHLLYPTPYVELIEKADNQGEVEMVSTLLDIAVKSELHKQTLYGRHSQSEIFQKLIQIGMKFAHTHPSIRTTLPHLIGSFLTLGNKSNQLATLMRMALEVEVGSQAPNSILFPMLASACNDESAFDRAIQFIWEPSFRDSAGRRNVCTSIGILSKEGLLNAVSVNTFYEALKNAISEGWFDAVNQLLKAFILRYPFERQQTRTCIAELILFTEKRSHRSESEKSALLDLLKVPLSEAGLRYEIGVNPVWEIPTVYFKPL